MHKNKPDSTIIFISCTGVKKKQAKLAVQSQKIFMLPVTMADFVATDLSAFINRELAESSSAEQQSSHESSPANNIVPVNSEVPCSVAADNTPPMAEVLELNMQVSHSENEPMAARNILPMAELSVQQELNIEVLRSVAANNTPLTAKLLVLKEPNIVVSRCDNQPMAANNTTAMAETSAQQDPNSEVPCSVAANNTPLTAELLVLKEPNIAVSRCDNQPMAADNTSPTAEPLAQPELNSEVPCSVAADNTPPMAELLAQQEPNIEVSRCDNQPMAANNTTVVAETSAQHDPNSKVPDSEKQPTVVNNTSSALLAPDCEQPTSVACANRRVLIEVQSSNNTKCSFFDLCTIPKRERKPTKRRTVHNFLLTSESHLQFVKDSIERKKPKKSKLNNLSAELEGENCSKKNAKTRKIKGQSDVKSSGKPAKVKSKQKNAGTAKRKVSSKCKKTTEDVDMEEK